MRWTLETSAVCRRWTSSAIGVHVGGMASFNMHYSCMATYGERVTDWATVCAWQHASVMGKMGANAW